MGQLFDEKIRIDTIDCSLLQSNDRCSDVLIGLESFDAFGVEHSDHFRRDFHPRSDDLYLNSVLLDSAASVLAELHHAVDSRLQK